MMRFVPCSFGIICPPHSGRAVLSRSRVGRPICSRKYRVHDVPIVSNITPNNCKHGSINYDNARIDSG